MKRVELFCDHFQNFKVYGIPHAQLIIADPPYNLGKNAYASNPAWYKDGDNKNGESELAGKEFFDTDKDFRPDTPRIKSGKMILLARTIKEDTEQLRIPKRQRKGIAVSKEMLTFAPLLKVNTD